VSVSMMTREEISSLGLTHGDRVRVTWSGGNGPYEYTMIERNGILYACDQWEIKNGSVDRMKTPFWMQHVERVA